MIRNETDHTPTYNHSKKNSNKMKKILTPIMIAAAAVLAVTACSDANEYEDFDANNPSWVKNYNDTLKIAHPESLANTSWVRGTGIKINAYGDEVQGFVESLNFVTEDSVAVKMSQGVTEGTWTDESNNEKTPLYEYTYSNVTGNISILKLTKDDKGKVSKTAIFTGVATSEGKEIITIAHFGDTPLQTYLVKK